MAKIFVRERGRVREGDRRPRYAVVGVHDANMTFFKTHLRKGELDAIAQSINAELVILPRGQGEHTGQEGGGANGKHARARQQGGDAATA